MKPKRRAGLAAPSERKKKSARKKHTSVASQVTESAKAISAALIGRKMPISPIDLMHGVITALNDCGVFFQMIPATENRFTLAWQSIPDERHHATIRLQAGPEWFYCRIFFTPLKALLDTDLILLEMERELQRHCGIEIERCATSTMTHQTMKGMTAAEVALKIFAKFSAYVTARARCELPSEQMRRTAVEIVHNAMQIGMPVVGDEDDR